MEPIERELQAQKGRQKRLAIELQRLEAIRPQARGIASFDDHDRKLLELRSQLQHLAFSIHDLEKIIVEKMNPPPKLTKPDVSHRRRLSDEERQAIAAKFRADLLRGKSQPEDWELHIHVGRTVDQDGHPEIRFFSRMRPYGPQKPSDDL